MHQKHTVDLEFYSFRDCFFASTCFCFCKTLSLRVTGRLVGEDQTSDLCWFVVFLQCLRLSNSRKGSCKNDTLCVNDLDVVRFVGPFCNKWPPSMLDNDIRSPSKKHPYNVGANSCFTNFGNVPKAVAKHSNLSDKMMSIDQGPIQYPEQEASSLVAKSGHILLLVFNLRKWSCFFVRLKRKPSLQLQPHNEPN